MCADFGSTTISSDVPGGRISPNAPAHVRASAGLYETEQRLSSRLDGATKPGGMLNLDFCEAHHPLHSLQRLLLLIRGIAGADRDPAPDAIADTRYFDVDTQTVLTRCWKTLVPREDYVAEVLSDVPDLYGELGHDPIYRHLQNDAYPLTCRFLLRAILGPDNVDLVIVPDNVPVVIYPCLPRRRRVQV